MKYLIVLLSVILQLTSAQILNGMPNNNMAIESNGREMLGMLKNNPVANNELAITSAANMNIINNLANVNTAANTVTSPIIPTNFNKLESDKLANTNFKQDPEVFKLLNDPINRATLANNILENNNAGGMKTKSLNLKIGNPCNCKNVVQGKIGNQDFDLHITPHNLEILGAVIVSGRMPLYSAVAVNGNIPTNGHGSVNFGCGSRTSSKSV